LDTSDSHHYGRPALLFGKLGDGLLIFGPEPCSNGFSDVVERLFLALRYAAGKGWTLSDDPAVLGLFQCDVEELTGVYPQRGSSLIPSSAGSGLDAGD
jgi:hypothetical protein